MALKSDEYQAAVLMEDGKFLPKSQLWCNIMSA